MVVSMIGTATSVMAAEMYHSNVIFKSTRKCTFNRIISQVTWKDKPNTDSGRQCVGL